MWEERGEGELLRERGLEDADGEWEGQGLGQNKAEWEVETKEE